jgi:hypothetical protein
MATTPKGKGRILEPKTPASETGGKKGRKAAPENETKAQAFVRIANNRLNGKVINGVRQGGIFNSLRVIGNLSNRAQYEYTDAQIDRIFAQLRAAVDEAESKFRKGGNKVRTVQL